MIVNEARGFDFNGTTLDEFDAILVDFNSPNSTNDEEGEIKQTKGSMSDRWDYHGVEYTSPLTFEITIALPHDNTYFTIEQIRELKKWLCIDKYAWLTFEQDDMEEIYYYCKITYSSTQNVGRNNAGLVFKVTCDAPYAWSEEVTKNITSIGTATNAMSCVCDFEEYNTRTCLKLTATSDGDIYIKNITDNNRIVRVDNCLNGEVITIDGIKEKISSNKRDVIITNWNKNFFELLSGRNELLVTGNCFVEVKYRTPIRVGA